MPPDAVGRNYSSDFASVEWWPGQRELHATFGGLLGFVAGPASGVELHFLGLVAGFDWARPAVIVPTFGRFELWPGTDPA